MSTADPTTEVDARYGQPDAAATPWEVADGVLAAAPLSQLVTLHADGRPHVTPLLTTWDGGALHFTCGPQEQKARNVDRRADVVVTVRSDPATHLDVVVDGAAERVTDASRLAALAEAWVGAHGEEWRFEVRDGAFWHEGGGRSEVFAVRPRVVWGFSTAEPFSQTRWTF